MFSLRTLVSFVLVTATISAAVDEHQSGGFEHIVIIDKSHPTPPHVAEVLERLALHENHTDVRHIYNNSVFHGFAASMKSHCLGLLGNMTDISLVEQAVHISGSGVIRRAGNPFPYSTRPDAPWGLQRMSTSSSMSGSTSAIDYTYTYADASLGSGADIYVIDTGIYTAHSVFGGRAKMLWAYDNDLRDQDGHGTHVSGTAAGAFLGMASNANIFGLKALDGEGGGWSSDIVHAIDIAIQRHDERMSNLGSNFTGSVISMSLASSGAVAAINSALTLASSKGIHACVAAGNSGTDACDSSPASAGGTQGPAITVGAIDISANRADFSNFGTCVDVYAPGVDIVSSWIGAPNMVNMLSGTSMATPHVTGLVAYLMTENSTLATNPALMKEWVKANSLQLNDGTLMANNGVRVSAKDGLLGFEKVKKSVRFTMAPSNGGTVGPR